VFDILKTKQNEKSTSKNEEKINGKNG
jgi:hypothetical protein